MKRDEIRIRDPFILPYEGKYYLFGTTNRAGSLTRPGEGFDVWISEDMNEFAGPFSAFDAPTGFWGCREFWAPEVHAWNGAFYMFATFHPDGKNRCTAILRAERPEGPYQPWSDGGVTPDEWMCLDGTLCVEDGKPYMVFCHEWEQIADGTICVMPLTDDLRAAAGEPVTLFSAKSSGWTDSHDRSGKNYVTDGPFLVRDEEGLWMFWSSFKDDGVAPQYAEGIAFSKNGVFGPWEHRDPLFLRDGGHGMVFRGLDGQLRFVLHRPNTPQQERPVFFPLSKENGRWTVKEA